MFTITILFATILIGCGIWIGYKIYRASVKKNDDNDMDDPTTTFWHE